MSLFHVHLFRVHSKAQTDVQGENEERAKELALKRVTKLTFLESDCILISLAWTATESKATLIKFGPEPMEVEAFDLHTHEKHDGRLPNRKRHNPRKSKGFECLPTSKSCNE